MNQTNNSIIDNYSFSKDETLKVKGIAILMMLGFHLFAFPERLPGVGYISVIPFWPYSHTIEELLANFGGLCLPIFIFLSGYGLTRSFHKNKPAHTFIFLRRKLLNFYMVYWTVFLIFIVPPILTKSPILGDWNSQTVILTFLGINKWINGEWWFVQLYIILLILFIPCFILLKKNIAALTFIIAMAFYFSYQLGPLTKTAWFLPTFVAGMSFALFDIYEKNPSLFPPTPSLKEIIPILSAIFILHNKQSNFIIDAIYTPFFVFWTSRINIDNINRILIIFGKNSFIMWLSHSFFCYYYFREVIFSARYSIFIYILLTFISLFTSITINFLIKKMTLKFHC